MKKSLFLLFLLPVLNTNLIAQDLPSIQTDRPDQTECPFITPRHYFQLENGFSYEKNNFQSELIVVPSTLTRFGITNYFELRLITEFVISRENELNYSGINPILIGFKTRLLEEKGIIPTTSLIAHIGFPEVASSDYRANYYYPEFRFTMQHTLSDRQTLSYNLGAEWNGIDKKPTFIYTLTTGYSLTEKIGAYIEFYGFIPQIGEADHRFDLGLTYLFNPNHQFDVSGGFGLSANSPEYYLALGYSFRFKT
ncbi:transporter [Flavobacterium nackdongense]|uniref:Transporter n=1 Tax=Flavobacterium nackdongense TaxID=2547394 RepID=A0A4P6Y8N1_9FLAO|nr:transporter [Flavobacterium nackdongense]QBN19176.1 transporter [Flavobacterium nackdongense]